MAASMHDILEWARTEGDVKVIDRIRVKILPDALGEGIPLASVDGSTSCSPELLSKLRLVAGEIVGKPCPV